MTHGRHGDSAEHQGNKKEEHRTVIMTILTILTTEYSTLRVDCLGHV